MFTAVAPHIHHDRWTSPSIGIDQIRYIESLDRDDLTDELVCAYLSKAVYVKKSFLLTFFGWSQTTWKTTSDELLQRLRDELAPRGIDPLGSWHLCSAEINAARLKVERGCRELHESRIAASSSTDPTWFVKYAWSESQLDLDCGFQKLLRTIVILSRRRPGRLAASRSKEMTKVDRQEDSLVVIE